MSRRTWSCRLPKDSATARLGVRGHRGHEANKVLHPVELPDEALPEPLGRLAAVAQGQFQEPVAGHDVGLLLAVHFVRVGDQSKIGSIKILRNIKTFDVAKDVPVRPAEGLGHGQAGGDGGAADVGPGFSGLRKGGCAYRRRLIGNFDITLL